MFSNPFCFLQQFPPVSDPDHVFLQKNSDNASLVAQTIVSCLKSARARGAVREPRDIGIEACLNLSGHLFSSIFLECLFHTNVKFVTQIASKLDPKYCIVEFFSEKT